MENKTKFGLMGLLAGLSAAGGYAALGAALYDRVMIPGPRDDTGDEQGPALCLEGRRWAQAARDFRGTSILSMEGLRLWGAWLPADRESHRWAVCVHGFRDDHTSVGMFAKHFHERGWNVLMPDQRGWGHSEGGCIGWGYDERLDLVGWISWLLRRDPKAEILLHGVAMGAATVLMATGGALPRNVKAAVSDCAYATLEGELRYAASVRPMGERFSGIPAWVAFRALRQTTLHRAGYDLCKVSPLEAVGRSKTPTLFIHGTEDRSVPAQMMGKLYHAARCPKEFLFVNGAGHVTCAAEDPALYWERVDRFADRYVPDT